MTRIRTSFRRDRPAVPENRINGVRYPLFATLSVDVEYDQEQEFLNQVLYTHREVVFHSGNGVDSQVPIYHEIIVRLTSTIEEGYLAAVIGPGYDNSFDLFLNASVAWDISRRARVALNQVAQATSPPTKIIEIGIKNYD